MQGHGNARSCHQFQGEEMKLKTVELWRKEFPGVKGLILMPVSNAKPNSSFILHTKEPAPAGKYRLLGVIE